MFFLRVLQQDVTTSYLKRTYAVATKVVWGREYSPATAMSSDLYSKMSVLQNKKFICLENKVKKPMYIIAPSYIV